jgi:hypothetical protein
MWVIRCSITGEYVLGSQSKAALANKTRLDYAKRYHTLSGAKSARGYVQSCYDYWHESHTTLCDRGYQEYIDEGRDAYLRKFEIIEI